MENPEFIPQTTQSPATAPPAESAIRAALAFIQNQATRGATVGDVFGQTQQVSRVTFHRRFRAVTGKSPAQALRERKLDEVRRLLAATDTPLAEVARLAGFSSSKVLARVFRASEGITLSQYRKRRQSESPVAPSGEWTPPPRLWG